MLMVKENFGNSLKLFRFKHKILWLLIIALSFPALFVLAAMLSSEFFEQSEYTQTYTHILDDFSTNLFFITAFSSCVLAFTYKSRHMPLRIYPQTREQHLFSEYILNYVLVLVSAGIQLAYYLLEFLACKILQHTGKIGTFVFHADKEYFVYGLVHYILELLLCTTLIYFLMTLFRLLRQYSVILAAGLAALGIAAARDDNLFLSMQNALDFVRADSTLPPFLLKAILMIVLLTAAAFVLNHFAKESSAALTRAATIIQAVSTLIFIYLTIFFITHLVAFSSWESTDNAGSIENKTRTLTVDTSALPAGTALTVQLSGKMMDSAGFDFANSDVDMATIYYDTSEPLVTGEHSLQITYTPMFTTESGVRGSDYMDSTLTAELDGTTLYLNYKIEGDVAVIPVWENAPDIPRFSDYHIKDDGTSASSNASMKITAE